MSLLISVYVMDGNKEVKKADEPVVVTLDVVKSLLSVQHESYRSTIQLFMTQMNEVIREVKKDISDLKMSANFTGKDVKELQDKVAGIEKDTRKLIQESYDVNNEFDILEDKHEYLENQSRRNNVKLIGVPESDNAESWEESEERFKESVKSALEIDASVMAIERAHRVGKKGGKKGRNGEVLPRPIVAKFLNWQDREKVLKSARDKRPNGLFFVEDLARRTLEKREALNLNWQSCFHNFFLLNSSVHQYSTRQASQGDLYLFRKNSFQYGLKSIRYLGAKLWNSLPVELRNAPSKLSFKKQMKIHLLSKANQ